MQREPFCRLLVALVMKLVIDGAGAERLDKITLNIRGKLTAIDKNMRAGHRRVSEQHPALKGESVFWCVRLRSKPAVNVLESVLNELRPVLQVQFIFNVFTIRFDGSNTQTEFLGNLARAAAFAD